MIRTALESDVPRLVELGERFRSETSYRQHLSSNPQQMAELARQLIAQDGVLVSEREGQLVGMIGFILYPHFLSGQEVAGEVFWYVAPEHRGEGIKLMREAERHAKLRGAQRMQMIAPSPKVEAFYRRLGYEYVETTYQRTL